MKKFIAVLVLLILVTVLVAACGGPSSSSSNGPTVHMGDSNFDQASVTINKGSSLTLVDDTSAVHIIENGSWINGNPHPAKEPGAPTVNVTFNGNDSHTIGPFNTAGTYHLYCVVHPGMNLTVIVR